MLEKPNFEDQAIIHCLHKEYGLGIESISFLPLGADVNTAVYRAVKRDATNYFVKLRRGDFNPASVAVPNHLAVLGMKQVIPAKKTQTGSLWAELHPYKVILYPYVEGHHGYTEKMSEAQWIEYGTALKSLHTADIPVEIKKGIPREDFSGHWRARVKAFLDRFEEETYTEPAAAELAAFLKSKRDETLILIQRSESLAQTLQDRPPEFILCHADIHCWNLLIDKTGALHMVDWDTLIYAPKERDLMFIGSGLADSGYTPEQESAMFYKGYGKTDIKPAAIAYYRYERIIEDIAAFCEQIFLSDRGGEDRKQAVAYVKSNYLPDGTIDRAYSG
jgi:spectinomycin phosphotransferase